MKKNSTYSKEIERVYIWDMPVKKCIGVRYTDGTFYERRTLDARQALFVATARNHETDTSLADKHIFVHIFHNDTET